MPINPQATGDLIDDADFLGLLDRINTERSRRGHSPISIDTTDNGGRVESEDYNALINGYNSMFNSGDCEINPNPLPTESDGVIIEWADIAALQSGLADAEISCVCDCNNCPCNANTCTCDCDNDNEGCTCNCNNSCSCNCNYSGSCICNCNYTACPSNCNSHCVCNCDFTTCP